MSVEIAYEEDAGIIVGRINGEITPWEYSDALNSLFDSGNVPSDANALWDLRNMAFHNADMRFIQEVIEGRKSLNDIRGKAKVAMVSDFELADILLEVFSVLSKESELKQSLKIFTNIKAARAWLTEQ